MAQYRKKEETEVPDRKLGQDALVTVEVRTKDGSTTRTFRVQGFVGNTLQSQRSGKGLDEILMAGLKHGFGGQVTAE